MGEVAVVQLRVRAINDLAEGRPVRGFARTWRAAQGDPQFALLEPGTVLTPGWYRLVLRWRLLDGALQAPVLYPDYGAGYGEDTALPLELPGRGGERGVHLHLTAPVQALRLDPSNCACAFALEVQSLERVDATTVARECFLALQRQGLPAWPAWTRARQRSQGDAHTLAELMLQERAQAEQAASPAPQRRGLVSSLFHGITAAHVQGESWRTIAGNALAALRSGGAAGFSARLRRYAQLRQAGDVVGSAYGRWVARDTERPSEVPARGPLVSVVLPTFEPPEEFLRAAIDSVLAQRYGHLELCIADDGSRDGRTPSLLQEYAARDARVRLALRSERGGIAANTNSALELAQGEYVLFLDHDDVLHADALASLAALVNACGEQDIVYSDHDYIGTDGYRRNPFFKPDWSPDLFLAQMYLGHFVAIRRTLIAEAGGLRSGCDGSQDYDLVLRCIAHGARVSHIPRVLYHWRQHENSTAANPQSKPYAHDAGRRAIQQFLDHACPGARALDGENLFTYDIRYPLPATPPNVAIIIPTRDRVDLLATCLDSLFERTAYGRFEVIVVDNESAQQETMDYLAAARRRHPTLRVVPAPVAFNWSHLNNLAADATGADVLVFLNNDTAVITPDWLERLVENALRPDIGVCAPLLLYEDRSIQHAGVVVGMGGWADHVYKGEPAQHRQDLFVSPVLRRNVLAVTGACMAVEARKFRELGGFDETFIVCGSDVDLCLRAHRRGWRNLYIPEARLFHFESKSRDPRAIPPGDFVRSAESYGHFRTEGDPLFNRNLDPMHCSPTLRSPPLAG